MPGEAYEVTVELEATTWRFARGHKLRLSVAGADWPNTAAPPEPVTLHVHGGRLELPVMEEPSPWPAPVFAPGDDASGESGEGVVWRVERDVLAGRTTCVIDHGSEYEAPYGTVVEHYAGRVSVDTATFEQRAESDVSFTCGTPNPSSVELTSRATSDVRATPQSYAVTIELTCHEGSEEVARRRWERGFPRQ